MPNMKTVGSVIFCGCRRPGGLGAGQHPLLRSARTHSSSCSLVEEIKRDVAAHGVSTLVHADGTRSPALRPARREAHLHAVGHGDRRVAANRAGVLRGRLARGTAWMESSRCLIAMPHKTISSVRPIMPDELAAWPYADRRRRVIDAINALAPFSDAPHEPNYAVENRIAAVAPGASPWSRYGRVSKTPWMLCRWTGETRSIATTGRREHPTPHDHRSAIAKPALDERQSVALMAVMMVAICRLGGAAHHAQHRHAPRGEEPDDAAVPRRR